METLDRPIVINDSTLRDGEQAPGVAFTEDERVNIARALDRAGVDELELGIPAMGDAEVAAVRAAGRVLKNARGIAWCRMLEEDVDAARRAGLRHVHLSIPLSDRMIEAKRLGSRQDVLARIERVVRYAQGASLTVYVGGEDASQAELDFVCHTLNVLSRLGVAKFRYADTVGVLDPFSTMAVFQRLRRQTELALEFHGHDDLGLATANTLAAVRGGATHASVCVLGLGERAGNAALEEVVTGLTRVERRSTHVDSHKLGALAGRVAAAAGRAIPEGKSIVGDAVFAHESGIHVAGLLRDVRTYEALEPASFGRARRIVLGKHSGRSALRYVLDKLGVSTEQSELDRLLIQVRERAVRTKRAVSASDLLHLYTQGQEAALRLCAAPQQEA